MVFLTDLGLDGFTMRSRYDALKNSPPGDGGTVGMTGKYDWDIYIIEWDRMGVTWNIFLGNWSLLNKNATFIGKMLV